MSSEFYQKQTKFIREKNLKERLKKIRNTLGYNLQEISEKLEIPVNTYVGYEYRTKNVPLSFLTILNEKLRVNINWLLTGKGLMFIKGEENTLELKYKEYEKEKVERMKERIEEIQEKNELNDREMAKILGIYEEDYIDIKRGEREPSLRIIKRIKESFNISIDWLIYGE